MDEQYISGLHEFTNYIRVYLFFKAPLMYASDNVACLPVPKHHGPLSPRTKNGTTIQRTNGSGSRAFHPSTASLLDVFIHADFDLVFEHGICVRIARPCKRDAIAKALVAP